MSIRVGIHQEPIKHMSPHLIRYERILEYNGIEAIRMCSSDEVFWEQVRTLDLFIYWWGQWDSERQNAKAILPIVEKELAVNCFPNQRTCWMFDDKIREYYLMLSHSFPIIKSWIFWEKKDALKWAKDVALPVVFKLSGGAGSMNVVLIKKRAELFRLINLMFGCGIADRSIKTSDSLAPGLSRRLIKKLAIGKRRFLNQTITHRNSTPNWILHKNYALFQEFLPNNDFDTRVTVIGNRAFAFRRFNREDDFRSSGSGIIKYDTGEINLEFVKVALEMSSKLGFQSMAYDFLYGKNGEIQFCEMSYAYVDLAVYKCPGYWDENLKWHEGHYWPQLFHLIDALQMPDLQQPDDLKHISSD